MSSWELSKENIQPLRQGRKISAMEGQDQRKIAEEKRAYEEALRTYEGNDPLEPWYEYITWVEQTFARGGKEGDLKPLLEKCIANFKGNEQYNQDERHLEIWIKFANHSPNALEVYNFIHNASLFDMLPKFYIEWAWELEQVGNYKKAEQTFKIAKKAIVGPPEARDALDTKHKQFQARVMKRMLEQSTDDAEQAAAAEKERSALSSLRGHGKQHKVGSVRVGAAVKHDGPGALPLPSTSQSASKPLASSNKQQPFAVFQDAGDENDEVFTASASAFLKKSNKENSASTNLPIGKQRNRENEQDPGKWTHSKIGKKSQSVPLDKISSKAAFAVHEDEGLETPSKSANPNVPANVLSAHKPTKDEDDMAVPLAYFEPPDPTKKPMYCKHLVYQGVTEFSFEELRGIKYKQRVADEDLHNKQEEMQRLKREMEEERKAFMVEQERIRSMQAEELMKQKMQLERMQQEALEKQREEVQKMLEEGLKKQKEELMKMQTAAGSGSNPGEVPTSRKENEFTVPKKPIRGGGPRLQVSTSSENNSSNVGAGSSSFKVYTDPTSDSREPSSSLLEDTKTLLQKDPLGGSGPVNSNPNSLHKTPPRLDVSNHKLSQPSPTINTKEAMNLVKEMWGNTPAASAAASNSQPQSVKAKAKMPFTVYEEEPNPPKFAVFCDENAQPAAAAPSASKPFAVFEDNAEANDENIPGPKRKSGKAGLRPRPIPVINDDDIKENEQPPKVSKAPAPIQVYQDEDEDDAPPRFNPNVTATMCVPSMEAFAEMAKAASTPFSGRRAFMPDEDENTCAIDIVFKKPTLPVTTPGKARQSSGDHEPQQQPDQQQPEQPQQQQQQGGTNLSTIVETSREQYQTSSSSSSNASQSQLAKSHWGNTQNPAAVTASASAATPGTFLKTGSTSMKAAGANEVTTSSGYMADSSRTPGTFLTKPLARGLLSSPSVPVQGKEKRLKRMEYRQSNDEEDDDDDEPTGLLAEFQKDVGLKKRQKKKIPEAEKPSTTTDGMERHTENSYMQQSLLASFMADREKDNTKDLTLAAAADKSPKLTSILEASKNQISRLELTKPNLDLTKSPINVELTKPNLDLTEDLVHAEVTAAQQSVADDDERIIQGVTNLSITGDIDPFSDELHAKLLKRIPQPVEHRHGFVPLKGQKVPVFRANSAVAIAPGVEFLILERKGEGGYATVYKAMKADNSGSNDATIANLDAVLKVQKPPREWEFYVCTEIHQRLANKKDSAYFMQIPRCYSFDDGTVFVSEHQMLTLLEICNQVPKMKTTTVEIVAMHFTIEILRILERLHKVNIIHADVKPDNFLLQGRPEFNPAATGPENMFKHAIPTLQAIDYGISIDMSLFDEGFSFTHSFEKAENICPEMLESKPWNYQLDYFGAARVAHTLLHGNYMKLIKKGDRYAPSGSLKRWWKTEVWGKFFDTFLNIESCDKLPDISAMRSEFEITLFEIVKKQGFEKVSTELNHLIRPN